MAGSDRSELRALAEKAQEAMLVSPSAILALLDENDSLRDERTRLLSVLWEIRMAAERGSTTDPVWLLPNVVAHLAECGMGSARGEAQMAAAALLSVSRDGGETP